MASRAFGWAAIALLAGVASPAFSADLVYDDPMAAVSPSASSGYWDGFYAGIFAGRTTGVVTDVGLVLYNPFFPDEDSFEISGWQVGARVGFDTYISDAIVAGVVADLAWTDAGGDFAFSSYSGSVSANWTGSLRARLGYDLGSVMPYATAGLALLEADAESQGGLGPGAASALHVGWTAGAGLELAVSENLSLNAEYRYSDFGEATYEDLASGVVDTPLDITSHQVTVGLNLRF